MLPLLMLAATLEVSTPGRTTTPIPSPTATPMLEPGVISGIWVSNLDDLFTHRHSTPEPPAGPVRWTPPCWSGGTDWKLSQSGTDVTATLEYLPRALGGAAPRWQCSESEVVRGTLRGDTLALNGTHELECRSAMPWGNEPAPGRRDPVSYDLRYDRRTGHLTGTRGGQPIWMAPAIVVPVDCGPQPAYP